MFGSEKKFGESVVNWRPPIWPNFEQLSGQFATLEPLKSSKHSQQLHESFSLDAKIWDYMPNGPFATLEEYQRWAEKAEQEPDPWFVAIKDNQTDKWVGVASYLRIKPESGSIEVGWISFSPLLQRTPAATDAMYLMMKWAFEAGYRRYEWKCDALNAASRRAAIRLGLSYEGVFRQATIYKGRNRDTAWFAAIDSEWPRLKDSFERWLSPQNFEAEGQQRVSLSELTNPILVAHDQQA